MKLFRFIKRAHLALLPLLISFSFRLCVMCSEVVASNHALHDIFDSNIVHFILTFPILLNTKIRFPLTIYVSLSMFDALQINIHIFSHVRHATCPSAMLLSQHYNVRVPILSQILNTLNDRRRISIETKSK